MARLGCVGYPPRVESPLHNVGFWLDRRAELNGGAPALIEGPRTLDYAALLDRTRRCAGLLSECGVGRGDRVALVLGNRSAYLEAVFAAARLGAIAVPINAHLTAREIHHCFQDCTPRVVIAERDLEPTVAAACNEMASGAPTVLRCGGDPDEYEAALDSMTPRLGIEAVSPDHPMILLYTSGTTGLPKGALLPHRKALFNSLNAQLFFELSARDRVLVVLPLFHSFGLSILALPTLYAGGALVLQRRFDPSAAWDAVDRERISFFGGVPTMFRSLLGALEDAPADRWRLDTLRFLFTAGAAIPVELIHAFEARGLRLKQGFGQTETSILCCLGDEDATRKAGSVGRPVFHADVRVVALDTFERDPAAWRVVAPGETGEIVVRGPITMLGYWQRPEATAETLRGEWLRTGDLARVDDEGFLSLVGRVRQMFISGGENVYPAEIEAVYVEHPEIREIAVVGIPDETWGEVGRAYVVPENGANLDSEALLAWGRERLAAFKVPRSFVALAALPRTATGKVQRHRLADAESG
jgi:fatty-acyl-CoA synthase